MWPACAPLRRRPGVLDAQLQVLDVVDGLVQEHGDVVVIQAVDDALAGAAAGDQAEVAQQPQLVGDRRLLHADSHGKLGDRARALAQPGVRISSRLGAARACRVVATLAADSASMNARAHRPDPPRLRRDPCRAGPWPAADFTAVPGRGVTAGVSGHRVEIGSLGQLPRSGPLDSAAVQAAEMEDSGQTAAVVRIDGKAIALLGIADRTRPAAVAAVARITAVTGTAPLLLTGDNARAARRLAAQVVISDEHAGLLPRDKVDAVKDLQAPGQRVLLAGGVGPGTGFAGHGLACGQAMAGPGRVDVRALQRPAC
jgi:hypothetical protein